ncbi:hypothetical protein [Pararobbsia silviterrae]|uniref:Transposase n=1 Tax=Pararobbsia silviterrae TaxID=1792498 RepID=A0A494XIH5_9BURK|nr:hypothetical protein [Pararobbsia silviterrae]RKP49562.1 hypothetical protein D7S86_19860 [Pararobbsia silviterrae]
MEHEIYKGYELWGHVIARRDELQSRDGYAASGTVMQDRRLVEASGVLDVFYDEAAAIEAGLAWARAWVDTHG